MKRLNLAELRQAIEAAPADGVALLPTERSWLEQVEAEVIAGRAASRELAAVRTAGEPA